MNRAYEAEKVLRDAAQAYRLAVREDIAASMGLWPADICDRELVRIISTRRGNYSSNDLPGVTNFVELIQRDEAIRALDRKMTGRWIAARPGSSPAADGGA